MKPVLTLLTIACVGCSSPTVFDGIDSVNGNASNGCQKMSAYGDIWDHSGGPMNTHDNDSANSLWYQKNCRSSFNQQTVRLDRP